ncbi:S8 family serine peptidase [Fictibacillus nanhaiensis]|uniref:S8 family serine peptidase n=1 Tax=Fictibacillus nanhaiensis TaxID=742169 RepID=UPI003C214300
MFKKGILFFSLLLVFNLLVFPENGYAKEEKIRVIITFQKKIDEAVVYRMQGELHHKFTDISIATATVPKRVIPLLKSLPGVESVKEEIQFEKASETVKQPIRWSVKKVNGAQTLEKGLTGKGIKVAVLDTGISIDHEDLKVAGGISTVEDHKSYDDDNGHGTHVAGIIGAQNNGIGALGVAPDSELYAVKVLNSEGFGGEGEIAAGIKWAIDNKMDIINMSLSSPRYSKVIENYINIAADKGIIVVAAAGNSGTPDGLQNTIEYPAKLEKTIAVGAIDKFDKRGYFSSSGKELDVVAPGVDVYSTFWQDGKNSYMVESGTSMAAPYVAGTLAVYKQKNPDDNLKEVLMRNTIDLGVSGKDNLYGNGLVQTERDSVAPTIPRNQIVSHIGHGDISLKWKASTEEVALKGYEIYRDGKKVKFLSGLSYHDYLTNGSYSYQIRAIDKAGNKSDFTSTVKATVSGMNLRDVSNNDWYAPHVIYLSSKSIVSGYADIGFSAGRNVKRSEAISMIGRAIGLNGTKRKTSFSDVNQSSFASGYIQSAFEAGIVSGNGDGNFHPEKNISRAEMAIMLSKAYKLKTVSNVSFTDVNKSMAAYQSINLVETNGITSGYSDGTFRPYSKVTRGQFAVFTARANNKQFRLEK